MASLLLIGAILIAIKYVDEHAEPEQRGQPLSTGADTITEPVVFSPTSKKNILSRTYWHERRRSRKELSGAHGQVESVGLSSEAPPPYERTIRLPMVCPVTREKEGGGEEADAVCAVPRA
ncbi:hypothetical protein BDW68DRAFT_158357 [Aspergillus falconensis]